MHCVMHYVMHHVMHYTFQVCREVFAQSMREHGGAACSHARLGTAQGPSSAPAPLAPLQALRPSGPQVLGPSGRQALRAHQAARGGCWTLLTGESDRATTPSH